MGADLYIQSIFKPRRAHLEPEFEKAVAVRDGLSPDTPEYNAAQKRVDECFQAMYSDGYFRDPYNSWDVLWKLGLSWWEDVVPNVDTEGYLSVGSVQELLDSVNSRLDVFEEKMSELREEDQRYFRERLAELQRFLRKAIELNEPVAASL